MGFRIEISKKSDMSDIVTKSDHEFSSSGKSDKWSSCIFCKIRLMIRIVAVLRDIIRVGNIINGELNIFAKLVRSSTERDPINRRSVYGFYQLT